MSKLTLHKETLRRLGTESLRHLMAGLPAGEISDVCPTNVCPSATCYTDECTGPSVPCQTGTATHGTSIRTTGP
ncbi:MAG TPA: hypothetical protein VJ505_09140 [Holophagaceae bacterium]|nr:hypothetical protein [Holophagaceae bacterium]